MDRIGIFIILKLFLVTTTWALPAPTDPSTQVDTGFDVRLNAGSNGNIIGPKCKGEEMNATMMIDAVETCVMDTEMDKVESSTDNSTTSTSTLCTTACIWKKLGLVDKDLMFTQDVTSFVIGTFPPISQPEIMTAMSKCASENKWPVSMTENCKSYGSMRKCMMDAVVEICKGSGEPNKKEDS